MILSFDRKEDTNTQRNTKEKSSMNGIKSAGKNENEKKIIILIRFPYHFEREGRSGLIH